MKISPWIFICVATALLSACGNADDRRTLSPEAIAAKNVAAIQVAMNQADKARKAVEAADSDKQLALQRAEVKRNAVAVSMARLAKESEILKKDAENKARWATRMNERAVAARKVLLQAALEQSRAEELVAEKNQAVQKARVQAEIHQDIAKKAMQEKLAAETLAANVVVAERLASLSLSQHKSSVSTDNTTAADTASSAVSDSAQSIIPQASPEQKKVSITKKPSSTAMAARVHKNHTKVNAHVVAARKHTTEIQLASTSAAPTADAVRGHGLAQKCQLCHSFEPNQKAKFGPELFGIVGQQAGKSQNYKYGRALGQASFTWDEKTLSEWICNSGKTIKKLTGDKSARTKMPNQNTCGQNARDIVAYLSTLKAQASNSAQTDSL